MPRLCNKKGITFNREQIAFEYDYVFDGLFCPGLFNYKSMKPFIYEIEREFGPTDSQFFGANFGSGFEEDYGPIDIEYQFEWYM